MDDRKLKVLYVCNDDTVLGGASLSLGNLLQSLAGAVDPVILLRSHGLVEDWFAERGYETLVIPFFRATFHGSGFSCALRYIPHYLSWTRTRRSCIREVMRRLSGSGVDLVHSNSGAVDIGFDLARALGVPHVWHHREYLGLGIRTRLFPSRKRWIGRIRSTEANIAITPGVARYLQIDSLPGTFCIPDAVRPANDTVFVREKEPFFLFLAGKIYPEKHPETALEAFAQSQLASEGYRMRMVGSLTPGYRAELDSLSRRLGISQSVDFIPFVDDVKASFAQATAFLMCSEFEGMGRVTIEAMFYGCPVIARNSGGSADILENRRTGFLFDSVGECAGYMRRVAGALPEEMILAAQREAVSRYSEENYGEKILQVYHKVLKEWK